jgi:hypothetical protein
MNIEKITFFVLLLSINMTINGQPKSEHLLLGRKYAEEQIKLALTDNAGHNVINSKTAIIKDSLVAIKIAETLLFNIYGKSNIISQKPYEIYHINNYWFLSGTLIKGIDGGTFLIIIDDRNSQIIKITHGM